MTLSSFTTIILSATEGMYLTQKKDVDIKERAIAKVLAMGKNDNPDNWIEIDEETANKYLEEKRLLEEEELKEEREPEEI